MTITATAQLALKTGETFKGTAPAYLDKAISGEVVFNTGMVGYVESLTDPSYAGQILVFTYPLIGNYGVTAPSSWESEKIHARAIVVSEMAPHYSNYRAEQSLSAWLESQQVPYLSNVDTRALTKCLRSKGVVSGALVSSADINSIEFEDFDHIDWVRQVSITEPRYYGEGEKLVIAVDCGMKENIMRSLQQLPVRIKRVPYNYDFSNEDYDGLLLSNGPGNPELCLETIALVKKAFAKQKPVFGICLGTQLMALAAGASTYKLPFGHRSHNQPCLDLSTNRAYLTSQNHGYAICEESLPKDWQVSFRNLNDQSVAGISHTSLPFSSVQFHPEAAPGPEDTAWLFQRFYEQL